MEQVGQEWRADDRERNAARACHEWTSAVVHLLRRRGVNSCPNSLTNLDNSVLAALDQSSLPAFLRRTPCLQYAGWLFLPRTTHTHRTLRGPGSPGIFPE